MSRTSWTAALLLSLLGCRADGSANPTTPAASTASEAPSGVVMSLLGTALSPAPMPPEVRADRQEKLDAAQAEYDAEPSLQSTVWLGRRTAYLGRYTEAISIYTEGLKRYENDPQLLRHRGHRYISTRQLDKALEDLAQAASRVEGTPDVVEQDGLPNPAGVPTGSLHTNIYYHLGLAQFLRGDFESARQSYEACLAASSTDDMRVATSHWLYMTLRRLGDDAAAARLLQPVSADVQLYENFSYLRLLLMYKGDVAPVDLIAPDAGDIDRATLGFGLGHWHFVSADERRAREVWRAVIKTPQWAAFGYVAAEAELARDGS